MLPAAFKLTSPAQFRRVMRNGRKAGRRTMVVYVATAEDPVTIGGPRCGLIVSKAVGNAVVRHRTSRRLRHAFARLIAEESVPRSLNVVLRALPRAGVASSADLDKDLRDGLRKVGVL